jgi:tetratricopeptide (TPR) repeat protein
MDFLQQQRLDDLFFEADQLIKEQKYTEAISTLQAILIEAPDYGKAYNHLGWIYDTKYRNYQMAEDHYRKCIVYTPEYTPVYLNLSITLSTLGKYDDQKDILMKALAVPGIDKATINNELAIMQELLGEYEPAIEHYKLAIRHSLIDANVDLYLNSIERCRKKQRILNA